MQVKDGAAWSALEYSLLRREALAEGRTLPPVTLVPAAISYTNKTKYRSAVILQCAPSHSTLPPKLTGNRFGTRLDVEPYMNDYERDAKGTTKKLTAEIERQMIQMSVNAPDWESLYAGRMAREILWPDEQGMNLDNFVEIAQTSALSIHLICRCIDMGRQAG